MLTDKQREKRLLVVVYDLCDGRTDKTVSIDNAIQHLKGFGIDTMTKEEFRTYHATVLERVKLLRVEAN